MVAACPPAPRARPPAPNALTEERVFALLEATVSAFEGDEAQHALYPEEQYFTWAREDLAVLLLFDGSQAAGRALQYVAESDGCAERFSDRLLLAFPRLVEQALSLARRMLCLP